MRQEEALQVISDVITAHNGEITHNDLVAELESAGKGKAVVHVLGLSQSRQIVPDVRATATPGQPPVLWYRLPGGDS